MLVSLFVSRITKKVMDNFDEFFIVCVAWLQKRSLSRQLKKEDLYNFLNEYALPQESSDSVLGKIKLL